MNPKISVIIPVYNVEKYLHQCVDSVLNQTYKNLEVILVDDGSPDNCPQICDEYAAKDSRVKVIHKENGGLSSARNAGMKLIDGDYTVFLDSDDYWCSPDFLAEVSDEFLKHSPDVVIFGYTKNISETDNHIRNSELEKRILKGDDESLKALVENGIIKSSACDKIVSSSFLKDDCMPFCEGIFSEDIDWTARLLVKSKKILYYDRNVYYYRSNSESISNNIKEKNIKDLFSQLERIIDLPEAISKNEYECYMNYCAYQYITLLNCLIIAKGVQDKKIYFSEAKKYRYLLAYHTNKKVRFVYYADKLFGFGGMMKALKLFLKIKG